MSDILLITPPFTQLNTPYPATAYLKGFLNTKHIASFQMDLGIEVILDLFSAEELQNVFSMAENKQSIQSENAERIFALKADYVATIDAVMLFLQGKNHTLARQICSENFLPQASRFDQLNDLEWAFGSMGMQDKAKHLATLYLEDLSDFIVECVDANFGFSRYAERIGMSANSFDALYNALHEELSFIDTLTLKRLEKCVRDAAPKMICLSVPFPGNLFSAFRCAQWIKKHTAKIHVVMGGGFANTELRSLNDPRVFDFFDSIVLDDGELPLELLWESLQNPKVELKRTFQCENGTVVYRNASSRADYKMANVGTPDYTDLLLESYISVIEVANPMHSLWSDGRWNKLTMAHGCYWGKCTFCDISLDYIKVYEPVAAKILVDRMEEMIQKTGETGFHFVDEAAPPALMRAVALEIIRRKLIVTWWTNIRFEKSFTSELCLILKASGCIAVSGGLEVASNRLLELIDKGVSVEQVARVTRNLTDSGILVHAYLMYGYPTQTIQETIDSLEMVRQLFELQIIQSGFWHQFALTAHSPIGLNPDAYGVLPEYQSISFANNDVQFKDKTGIDHSKFSYGLKKSIFNFMHGIGFEIPVHEWFEFKVPRTSIDPEHIESCLDSELGTMSKPTVQPLWLGGEATVSTFEKTKRGKPTQMLHLGFHTKQEFVEIQLENSQGEWFLEVLKEISIHAKVSVTLGEIKHSFESRFDDFEPFWYSQPILDLRDAGLLIT